MLPTATVCVMSDNGPVQAKLIFDTGSDRTYVSERLMKRVKGQWKGSVEMRYAAFGGGNGDGVFDRYDVQVTAVNSPVPTAVKIEAVRVPVICGPLQRPRVPSRLLEPFAHLPLADSYSESGMEHDVDILVGLDQYWSLVRVGLVRSSDGLVAQDTVFGWVLSGRAQSDGAISSGGVTSCQLLTVTDMPVGHRLWSLDDVRDDEPPERDLLQEFKDSVTFEGDRYVVKIPWKDDGSVSVLADNRKAAESRLNSLTRRLDRDPVLKGRYDAVLQDMESTGVTVEVPADELVSEHPTFYLPHRPVLKKSGSLKVRPVFDASAKGPGGISLNDCVEVGPALTPSLLDILIRFRRWRFGFSADIVKAFWQIGLRREDQDAHRFLWCQGDTVKVFRFQRVTFGVSCSPFLLNATIQYHLSQIDETRTVTEMKSNFYCDDFLSGADSELEVAAMLQEARSIMSAAGMELSKCTSNSPVVFREREGSEEESVKVLGVSWCPEGDSLNFVGHHLPPDTVATKRMVLSLIARMFDPLGFVTPFVMLAKILFQELWELRIGWDEPLPSSSADRFSRWVADCDLLREWRIPRCYSQVAGEGWDAAHKELHIFADASPKAYGAVVYLRLTNPDGSVSVSLLMSRARVAPLKRQTLPRLELLGCLLAAQLAGVVRKALHLSDDVPCRLYTDSMIALGWIRGQPQRWKQYVSTRVRQIQALTQVKQWWHCSGSDNPADMLTRGMCAEALVTSPIWLSGPQWLVLADPSAYLIDVTVTPDGEREAVDSMLQVEAVAGVRSRPSGSGSVGADQPVSVGADSASPVSVGADGAPPVSVGADGAPPVSVGADVAPPVSVGAYCAPPVGEGGDDAFPTCGRSGAALPGREGTGDALAGSGVAAMLSCGDTPGSDQTGMETGVFFSGK